MSERIRLTISVTPEVHEVFSRMADASGVSLGKCMGDWLADTAEGAQFVALKMQEARKAPKTVMRELQSMSHGLHELISGEVARGRGQGAVPSLRDGSRALAPAAKLAGLGLPPSSNTGGKVPRKNPKSPGGKGV